MKIIRKEYVLEGLNCAHCAAVIEKEAQSVPGVAATLNFVTKSITLDIDSLQDQEQILAKIKAIILKHEPNINLTEKLAKHQDAIVSSSISNSIWENIANKQFGLFIIGLSIFILALILKLSFWTEVTMFLVSYLIVGGDIIGKALRNITRGQVFDENFLMFIATVGAFSIREFPEAVAVMLFFRIGEFFQDMAVNRSRRSISELMDIRPDYANLKEGDRERKVSPEQVKIGGIIIIKPGEKVPLDGIVLEGSSIMDTSALTGEFVPKEVEAGSSVLAGFINKSGLLTVKVSKSYEQSTVARILDLVENASAKKAPTEKFITKFSRYYTPAVVLGAALLAILPPLLLPEATFTQWLNRALVFLVVSCPCALVISIPLTFFGGIGGASRSGILIKGSNYLEALNSVRSLVFDKTGTLTEGVFEVTDICPAGDISKSELLEMAALAESYSGHPIAVSIIQSYGREPDKKQIKEYREIPGYGVKAKVGEIEVIAGSSRMLAEENIHFETTDKFGTVVYLALNSKYAGFIVIADKIRADVSQALEGLRKAGVKEMIMLTGDNRENGERIGRELGFDQVFTELLPDQKVKVLEELERNKASGAKLAFIGDGINDAPVLARADIGIAMGGLGSDAAIEAADIVLMTDEPLKILSAIRIARRTRTIVWQNISLALGIKGVVLLMGAAGIATMWEAVFADVGVALIAVLNAMRVINIKTP